MWDIGKGYIVQQEVCKFCLTGLTFYCMISWTIKIKNRSAQAVVLDLTCLTEAQQGRAERGIQSRYLQECQIVWNDVRNLEGCLAEGMETVLQKTWNWESPGLTWDIFWCLCFSRMYLETPVTSQVEAALSHVLGERVSGKSSEGIQSPFDIQRIPFFLFVVYVRFGNKCK